MLDLQDRPKTRVAVTKRLPENVKTNGSSGVRTAPIAWAFLAPGLGMFSVFVALPALIALALAFFDWRLFDDPTFVGLKHLTRLLEDEQMWAALGVTARFVILGVIPTTLIGFLLSVIASTTLPGGGVLRVLFFVPLITSSAVTAVLWTNILDYRFGVPAQILSLMGIKSPNWLSDPAFAQPTLTLVMIWSALPLVSILYVSAIQKVPADLYAAAALDGAGKWRQLWSITWPTVRPTTLVILVLMLVFFLGSPLEFAVLVTKGGPIDTTTTLIYYAYEMAFELRDMGYASAIALVQLVLVAGVFGLSRGIAVTVRRFR